MSTLSVLAASTALTLISLIGWLRCHTHARYLRHQVNMAIYQAGHDRLTGLPTRDTTERAFIYRACHTLPTIIVLIDLDHFKTINDTHGHDIGDHVLVEAAHLLAEASRDYSGMTARLGGDEFLLLLPDIFDDNITLADVLAGIHTTLAAPLTLTTDNTKITLTLSASTGAAIFDGIHGTFATMLHHADIALYHAKRRRGSYVIHHRGMRMPSTAGRHHLRPRDQHPHNSNNQGNHDNRGDQGNHDNRGDQGDHNNRDDQGDHNNQGDQKQI